MTSGGAVVQYRHPAGFRLPLPADWEQAQDPRPGVSLVAVEPPHGGPFRANVVVTLEPLATGEDLDAWQTGADALLAGALRGYLLIDLERVEVDGRPALRRLAHHEREESGAVTMEQWAVVANGLGLTLTASAGTLEYDALAPTFAAIAAGLRP